MSDTQHVLHRPEFPRSNSYDPDWVMENQMGPNALWLLEWLCGELDLKSEMRVLDLGCGTAMTSIFLAREFGVRVWAADLWVDADDNWRRISEAGVGDRVCPIRTECHALPFAEGFFDVVVSVDSYQYYGTDEHYMGYLSRLVRPGGRIGIVVPALMQSFEGGIPEHLTRKQANGARFWEEECRSFITLKRWCDLWGGSSRIAITVADELQNGWQYWRDFETEVERAGKNRFPSVAEALEADRGRYLGFVRLVAVRTEVGTSLNLYDPGVIARLERSQRKQ
jgi:cyclopropane fatty-acyl-phospholipid synthase-like methyltransferase